MDAQPRLLQPTRLLEFIQPAIEALVQKRSWRQLPMYERIGAATPDLSATGVEWRGQDTCIQKDRMADDFGVFDSPEEFHVRHGSILSGLKRRQYSHVIRHRMSAHVQRIRAER